LDMIIEYIPWATGSDGHTYSPIWVTNPSEQRIDHDTKQVYLYVQETMMRELGHTLGLADLYRFGGYSDSLMGRFNLDKTTDSILSNDIEYLSDVYRNHSPYAT